MSASEPLLPANTSAAALFVPSLAPSRSPSRHSPEDTERDSASAGSERKSMTERKSVKAEVFERKSLKFWVHPNNVSAVTKIMQKYVPIHRRGMIHSVYMDNAQGDIYSKRLVREEDSKLLRFRW